MKHKVISEGLYFSPAPGQFNDFQTLEDLDNLSCYIRLWEYFLDRPQNPDPKFSLHLHLPLDVWYSGIYMFWPIHWDCSARRLKKLSVSANVEILYLKESARSPSNMATRTDIIITLADKAGAVVVINKRATPERAIGNAQIRYFTRH